MRGAGQGTVVHVGLVGESLGLGRGRRPFLPRGSVGAPAPLRIMASIIMTVRWFSVRACRGAVVGIIAPVMQVTSVRV